MEEKTVLPSENALLSVHGSVEVVPDLPHVAPAPDLNLEDNPTMSDQAVVEPSHSATEAVMTSPRQVGDLAASELISPTEETALPNAACDVITTSFQSSPNGCHTPPRDSSRVEPSSQCADTQPPELLSLSTGELESTWEKVDDAEVEQSQKEFEEHMKNKKMTERRNSKKDGHHRSHSLQERLDVLIAEANKVPSNRKTSLDKLKSPSRTEAPPSPNPAHHGSEMVESAISNQDESVGDLEENDTAKAQRIAELTDDLTRELNEPFVNLDTVKAKCIQNLCIPDALRPEIWKLLLGIQKKDSNPLNQWDGSLDLMNQRVIRMDCERTRADQADFRSDEVRLDLERVLTFYCKRKSVKYKQGLNEVLAPFMYLKSPSFGLGTVFNCFYSFISRYLPNMFGDDEFMSLQCAFSMFRMLMLYHDPVLCHYLDRHSCTPELYATSWFLTLFASKLSLPLLFQFWDRYLLEDDQSFFCFIGLALLQESRDTVLNVDVSLLPQTVSRVSITSESQLNKLWQAATALRASTPRSFRQQLLQTALQPGRSTDNMDLLLAQLEETIALEILPAELVSNCYNLSEADSELGRIFIFDCRSKRQFDAGHLPTAFHLDPMTCKTEEGLAHLPELFDPIKGSHICFLGVANDKRHNAMIHHYMRQFIDSGFPYVSRSQGGFFGCHDLALSLKLELVDHLPKFCTACNPEIRRKDVQKQQEQDKQKMKERQNLRAKEKQREREREKDREKEKEKEKEREKEKEKEKEKLLVRSSTAPDVTVDLVVTPPAESIPSAIVEPEADAAIVPVVPIVPAAGPLVDSSSIQIQCDAPVIQIVSDTSPTITVITSSVSPTLSVNGSAISTVATSRVEILPDEANSDVRLANNNINNNINNNNDDVVIIENVDVMVAPAVAVTVTPDKSEEEKKKKKARKEREKEALKEFGHVVSGIAIQSVSAGLSFFKDSWRKFSRSGNPSPPGSSASSTPPDKRSRRNSASHEVKPLEKERSNSTVTLPPQVLDATVSTGDTQTDEGWNVVEDGAETVFLSPTAGIRATSKVTSGSKLHKPKHSKHLKTAKKLFSNDKIDISQWRVDSSKTFFSCWYTTDFTDIMSGAPRELVITRDCILTLEHPASCPASMARIDTFFLLPQLQRITSRKHLPQALTFYWKTADSEDIVSYSYQLESAQSARDCIQLVKTFFAEITAKSSKEQGADSAIESESSISMQPSSSSDSVLSRDSPTHNEPAQAQSNLIE